MLNPDAEARTFHLGDLPLVHRLKAQGISLDSEAYLARGLHTAEDAVLSRLPLVDRGAPTLIVRYGKTRLFGQFRHKAGDSHAHIVFVAPSLTKNSSYQLESAWLYFLDALAAVAAQSGAHTIHAEVAEDSVVFEVLRKAGYVPFAQQDIWRRDPQDAQSIANLEIDPAAIPRPAMNSDMPAVRYLHAQMVPRLAQKADPPPAGGGLVLVREGKACCYLAVNRGNRGIYIKPYVHPDNDHIARSALAAVLGQKAQGSAKPVYVCLRRYQSWLGGTLETLGFKPWARQTVMVKQTTARVEHPAFAPLPAVRGGISLSGGPRIRVELVERQRVS